MIWLKGIIYEKEIESAIQFLQTIQAAKSIHVMKMANTVNELCTMKFYRINFGSVFPQNFIHNHVTTCTYTSTHVQKYKSKLK